MQSGDEITASSGNLSSELSNNANASGGSAVLSIGNFSTPYIKVQANEVDISSIKTGQNATITLDAFPGKTFVGKVTQVDSIGTTTSGVVTYNVFVNFVAPPDDIKLGMSATVTIQTARKDDVITVPSAAVQTTNGEKTVRVLKNGQITSVPVTTGLSSDTDTEIISGVSEGDTVITSFIAATQSGTGSTSPFGGGLRFGGGGFGGGNGTFIRGAGGGGGNTGGRRAGGGG